MFFLLSSFNAQQQLIMKPSLFNLKIKILINTKACYL